MIRWQPIARARRRRLALAIALPLLATLALGLLARTVAAPVLVNESPSLPRGLYWRAIGVDPGVGSVVALPQPARARPYLASLGLPGEVLLIKRVAAAEGDRICRRGGRIDLSAGGVTVRQRDRQGRPLAPWTGCRRLGAGEVFLIGDTPDSYDSRYFGPVVRADLVGVYREGPTW